MVLSPEHLLVPRITTPEQRQAVEDYKTFAAGKSDLERTELAKEKSGVFTGAFAINPVNGEKIPIWIADYVLASYGTGAIMAVPAHDIRDFDFATKYGLKIRPVVGSLSTHTFEFIASRGHVRDDEVTVTTNGGEIVLYFNSYQCDVNEGHAVNSSNVELSLNGLPTPEAKKKITAWLEEKNLGKKTINYKLRDWLFSRQRYWGEPFPIVWKKDGPSRKSLSRSVAGKFVAVLPPTLEDYKPTATGEPPLARAKDWVNLPDGSVRETNTMPQWAGSCWYYLRYLDAKNNSAFVGKDVENYWMGGKSAGVDLYVGGTEHAVLHLLYARFWHKVLFDLGSRLDARTVFQTRQPRHHAGRGQPEDVEVARQRGESPWTCRAEYGTDALRLYEMFMGPLEMVKPWSSKGVEGVYRFLGRVWRLFVDEKSETEFEQAETDGAVAQRKIELLI
jgi:leucyl-tRNA synthetase